MGMLVRPLGCFVGEAGRGAREGGGWDLDLESECELDSANWTVWNGDGMGRIAFWGVG